MTRQDGATTRQMQEAPKGAVFVWCNDKTSYPRDLARHLGRDDLLIKSPEWLEHRWHGLSLTGVIVDHSASLTRAQWEGYQGALTRVLSKQ